MSTTLQSSTGLSRRAFRCNPARPVTPTIRDSFPPVDMVRPPSVAPGPCTTTATPLGSALGPLRTLPAHTTTPTGAGTSNGPRPPAPHHSSPAIAAPPRRPPGPFPPWGRALATTEPRIAPRTHPGHARRARNANKRTLSTSAPLPPDTWAVGKRNLGDASPTRTPSPTTGPLTCPANIQGGAYESSDFQHLCTTHGPGTGPTTRPVPRTSLQGAYPDTATPPALCPYT